MFLTGKFRNLLNFMKREMSWKIWHCSLFLLLAYNVLTEKKRKKIRYWAKKQNLFSCIVCSGWDLKERIGKKRKNIFLHFFSLSLIIDIFHTMPFVSSDCDYYNTPAFWFPVFFFEFALNWQIGFWSQARK